MERSANLSTPYSQRHPLSVEQYASLVAALYRGRFQEKPWEDFLAELRDLCQPCLTVIGLRLPTPGDAGIAYVGGADYSAQDMMSFANKYSALAPLVDLPDGETVALDDLVTREQLHQTTYYQTFMQPFNQEQVMGFDIHRGGKVALFLRLIRGPGEPDFDSREREIFALLKPQFRELALWLETSGSLARKHDLYEQAFSSLALGTVILDTNLSIVYLNSIADQLLTSNSGIASVGGKLRLMRRQEHQHLQQVLADLLCDSVQKLPQVISIKREEGRSPLFLTMRRLPLQDRLDDTHHIALYLSDPELRQIDQTQLVIEAFGLTPQEARLVIALANGGTLENFANDLGVSKNTARTHLYASFRKVGVTQQSSLVSHVIRAIHGL
ncbi:helix-turn-helix transcriptional regulator [Pseudohalioglobus lutimaris]|uniref:Helix-turn-helix transcriptional regulator n=1 Tax=Pseudohalioglobus lutimaris TaxID=1737061 RepID=A0A2N5X515_9GAMM|nr:helix-turn-helix transcriptional regulator [Pseudohalioglobus lutimaris]PLW69579.1 helix-turn-helix transcriptional regulator [Pseudohalioglobus lutimaris]